MSSKILVNPDKCTGCRSCEVACSYHHSDSFTRENSSIRIKRDERKGEFEILIYDESKDNRPPCDGCNDIEEPLCVKFCLSGALEVKE